MKFVLYPLIGILYVSNALFQTLAFNGELAVTLAGAFASFAIGAVYLGPLLILERKITAHRGSRSNVGSNVGLVIIVSCIASVVGIVGSEASGSAILLVTTTVAAVLSFVSLGALSIAQIVAIVQNRNRGL